MPEPRTHMPPACSCCGGVEFAERQVLWPELIQAWELSPAEVAVIDRQQGRHCVHCGSTWRSLALASAFMTEWEFEGLFRDFVIDPRWQSLRVLEVNKAGWLSAWLERMPLHELVEYPAVDLQRLPFADASFDVVIHSDTLEHIPDPLLALQECRRVLAPGGRCLLTVPLLTTRMSRSCAGRVPSYHGDVSHPADCRVHTEFGADAWTWPLRAGFAECRIHAWDFPSALALSARVPRPALSSAAAGARAPDSSPILRRGGLLTRYWHPAVMIREWAVQRNVLHINCGDGTATEFLAESAQSVLGLVCHGDAPLPNAGAASLRYCLAPNPSIPAPDQTYDLVYWNTESTANDSNQWLDEARRVLRPDGLLVVYSPLLAGAAESSAIKSESPMDWSRALEVRFKNVSSAAQQLCGGSLVWPLSGSFTADRFTYLRGDPRHLQRLRPHDASSAILYVATNRADPPDWSPQLYVSPGDRYGIAEEAERLSEIVAAMKRSTSWRVTAPLRWLSNLIRGRSPSVEESQS
ncbi:MAG: methyltransferase domain-containing protein [Planctomycetaceae bacterium]|nr:methyltransferase domain-containing protein [Planctomycetaceae bacterium]